MEDNFMAIPSDLSISSTSISRIQQTNIEPEKKPSVEDKTIRIANVLNNNQASQLNEIYDLSSREFVPIHDDNPPIPDSIPSDDEPLPEMAADFDDNELSEETIKQMSVNNDVGQAEMEGAAAHKTSQEIIKQGKEESQTEARSTHSHEVSNSQENINNQAPKILNERQKETNKANGTAKANVLLQTEPSHEGSPVQEKSLSYSLSDKFIKQMVGGADRIAERFSAKSAQKQAGTPSEPQPSISDNKSYGVGLVLIGAENRYQTDARVRQLYAQLPATPNKEQVKSANQENLQGINVVSMIVGTEDFEAMKQIALDQASKIFDKRGRGEVVNKEEALKYAEEVFGREAKKHGGVNKIPEKIMNNCCHEYFSKVIHHCVTDKNGQPLNLSPEESKALLEEFTSSFIGALISQNLISKAEKNEPEKEIEETTLSKLPSETSEDIPPHLTAKMTPEETRRFTQSMTAEMISQVRESEKAAKKRIEDEKDAQNLDAQQQRLKEQRLKDGVKEYEKKQTQKEKDSLSFDKVKGDNKIEDSKNEKLSESITNEQISITKKVNLDVKNPESPKVVDPKIKQPPIKG